MLRTGQVGFVLAHNSECMQVYKVLHLPTPAYIFTGFLCGKCPVDQGVDLTLNGCKKCTLTDAGVFALIGKMSSLSSIWVMLNLEL